MAKRIKTEKYILFSKEIDRIERHIPLIERELKTGRHPVAVLGTFGWTFLDDIDRLKEYLLATDRKKLVVKLDL